MTDGHLEAEKEKQKKLNIEIKYSTHLCNFNDKAPKDCSWILVFSFGPQRKTGLYFHLSSKAIKGVSTVKIDSLIDQHFNIHNEFKHDKSDWFDWLQGSFTSNISILTRFYWWIDWLIACFISTVRIWRATQSWVYRAQSCWRKSSSVGWEVPCRLSLRKEYRYTRKL